MNPYYQDDSVTIYHGDALEVLPSLPEGWADLLITDPPYAAPAATVTTGRARQKWGINWGDLSLLGFLADSVLSKPVLTANHEVYWFGDHMAHAALLPHLLHRYKCVQTIVWDKEALGMGAYYRKQTELILYARMHKSPRFVETRRDIVRLKPAYGKRQHPAEKPEALMRHLISGTLNYCVLDPFMGTGAAILEIEERYCEIAAKRMGQEVLPLTETRN